jgi:hypothetical protein
MPRLFAEPTKTVFSSLAQADLATGLALASAAPYWFTHENDIPFPKPDAPETDAEEYSNSIYLSEYNIPRFLADWTQTRRLITHDFIMWMGLLLGGVTSAQLEATDAYKHRLVPDNTTLDLLAVTMWNNTPARGNLTLPGICCGSVELSCARGEFPKLSAGLMGIGTYAAGVDISATAKVGESYLRYGGVDILVGGTYSKTTGLVTSGVSIAPYVRSFSFKASNGAERQFEFGDVNSILKGDLKALGTNQLTLTFEPEDTTYLDYLEDETEFAVQIVITGGQIPTASGYYYTASIVLPIARVIEVPRLGREKSVQVAELTIEGMKDIDPTRVGAGTDYHIIDCYGQNDVTAYLTQPA